MSAPGSTPLALPARLPGLPAAWRWARLMDVCLGIFDCPHSTPELAEAGPYLARTQDVRFGTFRFDQAARVSEETYRERTRRAEPKHGDLLFSREGTYFGVAAEIPPDIRVCLGQRMVLLRPNHGVVNSRFLRLWLNSAAHATHLEGFHDGSVAQRLNVSTIRGLPVPVPPLSEQEAISEVLGALDDKAEINRQLNETLEEFARTLFTSWFVDFDPVTAKRDGRMPVGVPPEAVDLFPGHFEESTLGPIPRGWRVQRLAAFTKTQYGYTASAKSERIGPHFLRITDMNKEPWIDWSGVPFCQADEAVKEKYGLRVGDILVSRMADPGKAGIVEEPVDAVFASYLVRLDAAPSRRYWLYYFLRSDEYLEYAEGAQSGTVQANMNAQVIVGARAAVPPEELSSAFDSVVRPFRTQIVANLTESRTLAALRDTSLGPLLSGELTIKSAEKAVAAAL